MSYFYASFLLQVCLYFAILLHISIQLFSIVSTILFLEMPNT